MYGSNTFPFKTRVMWWLAGLIELCIAASEGFETPQLHYLLYYDFLSQTKIGPVQWGWRLRYCILCVLQTRWILGGWGSRGELTTTTTNSNLQDSRYRFAALLDFKFWQDVVDYVQVCPMCSAEVSTSASKQAWPTVVGKPTSSSEKKRKGKNQLLALGRSM